MKANESVAITLLRKGQPITVNATLVEKDVPELVEGTFEGVAPALAPKIMQWEGMGDPGKLMKRLRVDTNRNATIVSSDGEQTLELSQNDGKKNLVVKDKSGKVIFEGPIDTPEQKAKLPQGVEEKLTSMEGKLHKITVRIHADDKEEHEGEDKKSIFIVLAEDPGRTHGWGFHLDGRTSASSPFSPNSASVKRCGSKVSMSSGVSPRPTNFTGIFS
jgi:hypothetical protein